MAHVGGQQRGEVTVLRTGFEHDDATVFFNHVGRDFVQALWANGGRRFDQPVESEIRPQELAVRRRNVYEVSGVVQFILSLI